MKKIMLSAVLAGSLISSVAAASISFKDAAGDISSARIPTTDYQPVS